jgi:hypothetical protein
MKALILSLLTLMALGAQAQTAPSRSAVFADANASASGLLTALYAGDLKVTGTEGDSFSEILHAFAEDFYVQGYISLTQSQGKQQEVDECVALENQYRAASGDPKKALKAPRNEACGKAVNFQGLAANGPACVNPGAVVAGAQCCPNTKIGVSLSLEAGLTGCRKTNLECSGHGDCCSKICSKSDGDAKGVCAPVMACFAGIPLNGECSLENTNCSSGVCRLQEQGLGGVTCKPEAAACAAATDCCSGKCTSGKCAEKFLCTDCVPEGQKPGAGRSCCNGFIQDVDGACSREMPPFILPTTTLWQKVWRTFVPIAHAQEVGPQGTSPREVAPKTVSTGKTSVGATVNDGGLTKAQLDMIEGMVRSCMSINAKDARATCLRASYSKRKDLLEANNAAAAAGRPVGETFTQEEYVQRYNIPAITPKTRSDVARCEFNSIKDNWIDASNLHRNAELFVRAFEVSYSGRGTQDFWHLPTAGGGIHEKNIYSRSKGLMSELRENRHAQKDQLAYMDLMMACQCLYAFGPDKFDGEKQAFFHTMCTGNEENKICRDGDMKESLKIPDSPEAAYREGREFPNYVEMYLANLAQIQTQAGNTNDVASVDSSAAGINKEEVLVRWLRLRSCNQVDVFVDTEKLEGEMQSLAEDLNRAKKPVPHLTAYWNTRLQQMSAAGVDKAIIDVFRNDPYKDTYFRGYVDTESKVFDYSKKTPKFLFFLLMLLLAVAAVAFFGVASMIGMAGMGIGGVGVVVGVSMMGGGGATGFKVMDTFLKDFPNPMVETRLVEKKSCMLGLFWCKKFSRILHWPAFSNAKGIDSAFPFVKDEKSTCDAVAAKAAGLPGTAPNGCSGNFKGTMCARAFLRPMADNKIAGAANFAPWAEIMKDKMLMDPVFPENFKDESIKPDYKWKEALNEGFKAGCAWAKGLGKKNPTAQDKLKFLPDMSIWMDSNYVFKPEYQMHQARIDDYKAAVAKYALCDDLRTCGAKYYDGKHPNPRGFVDIMENQEQADLFANYVYQIHFKWRHMSGIAGIGYPLSYLENYYLALLHNLRILTTLSIRRGLELDEAVNRYSEDLAVRRSQFQVTGQRYGLGTGNPRARSEVRVSEYFQNLRTMGFPLVGSFGSLENGKTIRTNDDKVGATLAQQSLMSANDRKALAAASRHASRVAKDKEAWKNFQSRTGASRDGQRRLAAAGNFYRGVNSPTSAIASLGNPRDSSSYSGVGGVLSNAQSKAGEEGKEATQQYGAVERTDLSGADSNSGAEAGNAGFGASASGGASWNLGDESVGASADAAGSGHDQSDKDLKDAASMTGMAEGDVQKMLNQAEIDRRKLEGGQDDGLFEKVSKAYLRNLDRVLLRKSAAPAPSSAPATPAAPDKEEIKKIFNQ